jgi:NADP-dependent 3-hydroxy acid dehydrogenase YdfG
MTNIIILTGANSGIGLACVKQFCVYYPDHTILAISRSIDNLQIAQQSYSNCSVQQCDITNFLQLQQIIEYTSLNYKIVGLINCAGISYNGDICSLLPDQIQALITTNTIGISNCIQAVLPTMRSNNNGTIINISSLADRYPRPNNPIYAATKAFVKSLSESLRSSEAKYNIRICNISPALVNTPMLQRYGSFNDTIEVSQFVDIIQFVYSQPQSVCIRDIVVAPTSYEQ